MRRAQSTRLDTSATIAEVLSALAPADLALIVLCVGDGHDLPRIERVLADLPDTGQVMGCTTAGEIGTGGYLARSITARNAGRCKSRPMGQLANVVTLEQQVRARTRDLAEALDKLRVTHAIRWCHQIVLARGPEASISLSASR